jgi:hypothetical protein
MVVTDRTPDEAAGRPTVPWLGRWARPALPALEPTLPLVVAGAVLGGLVLALAVTPIGSGDYGQWLMTSRAFLGEPVPAYRELDAVPPLVPALLAAIRVVVPDPFAALHVLSAILLLGLGASFFALGTVALGTRWGGALAVVIGLLVTDRYTDLFAFGGLLQIGAIAFGCLSVAGILRAARDPLGARGAWAVGAIGLALAAVTHVGTGMLAVPIGLALAGLVALVTLARADWDLAPLLRHLLRPGLAFAVVGLYWLVVLVPASGDYVTNPASLAYRGPDRLWADLFDRWPTAVVIVVGAAGLGIAAMRSLLLRRLDALLLVAVWAALAWGLLAWSLVSGSATDFPRFATPILTPLLVGAAAAVLWALRAFAASLVDVGYRGPASAVVAAGVVLAVVVAAPLTIERHVRQAEFYELRNAEALADVSAWLAAELPADATVLADVREAKWIEGLSGHATLFSQPVRYAFRPDEWQRSTDADALLRSTMTITSGFVSAQFLNQAGRGDEAVPTGVLVRANHGGEFIDLLRMVPAATQIDSVTAADLLPVRAVPMAGERQAGLRTVWGLSGVPSFSFTQTVTAFDEGTTLRLVQAAPGHTVSTVLTPAAGMEILSLDLHDDEAVVCFTELGGSSPCLRVRTAEGEGSLSASEDGLRVTSGRTGEIELHVTALTAGDASVGLALLEPADLVHDHDVQAAVLHQPDPAYRARVARLEALGFREGPAFGPYRVLLHAAADEP